MVSVGEGASAPAASTYGGGGGGGGVGGKATRNQFRRSRATPYDRPPTAHRNPSLLSKLVVDPIKNLASSAAHRFFASVTGKRLTPPAPPPLPPESVQEFDHGIGDAVIKSNAEAPEPSNIDGQKFPMADTGGISELEHLLRQKTFTKSEIDHLTELLQSKAVDLHVNHNVERVEAKDPVAKFEKPLQLQKNPLAENGNLRERSHSVISTPGITTRGLDEDVASPAELAKAYMGSRPSKISPSMLGLRSQAFREEAALLSSAPFTPKSPMVSLAPKVTPRLELAEKSFTSARSRGRSALYNMARTPYSRLPRTALGKETEPRRYRNEGYLLPSSSLQDQDAEPSSTKLVLKRRSSVLDDDVGSVGPMRRIRQKHSLSSQRFNVPATRGIGGSSGSLQQSLSPKENFPLPDDWKYNTLKMVGENEDNCAPSTSYAHVPPKSTEMAARILQQLEKVAPKEKSAESKLVIAKEKSPAKLTTEMLHGQALRSLEDANSPKLLQSTQGNQRLEDLPQSSLIRNHQEQERIEQNGPKTLNVQHEVSTPIVNRNSATSVKVLVPNAVSDSTHKLVAERPQKKRAFMMSAHEDSLDLDEETYSNGRPEAVGGRGKSETSLTNHSSVSAEKVVEVTTAPLLEVKKSPAEPMFGKKTDLEDHSAAVISGEKNGVAFPALHTFSTSPSVSHSQLTSMYDEPKQENKKVPGPENSSVHSVPDLSAPKPSFWTHASPENLSSSGAIIPTQEVPGSDKHDNIKAVEGAELQGRPENLHSSPSSVPSSTVASSVPENLNLKNGPLSINPSTVLSTPAVASTGIASQSLAAGTSPFSNAANVTNFAASTWSSATTSISPFGSSGTPMFQFGSSVNPSTVASSSVSTTSDAVSSVGKTNSDKEANASSLSNTPLGGTSFATGSSIFGLSSSTAASSKSPSETTSSGFLFSTQSSDAVSGAATISKDVPFQFGSSASPSVFCSSGVSSFTSSSPIFSSSAPAADKLFGSGASFGLTSTSSVETKSVDCGSGPSGLFSFGTGASAASSGVNAFSISSGTSSSTFSFGMSSSVTSSLPNAPVSSSSTPPAIFNFGASSSSGTGMISSSTGTGSAIFGASTPSLSSETNAASSSGGAAVSFGSNWQTPNSSPFGAMTSSPVFSFGASSPSFSAGNTAPVVFGSTSAASPGLGFSFTTASAGTSVSPSSPFSAGSPIFGNSTSTFTSSGNNDQMSVEDSMAEDVQATAPAIPVFGQQPVSASPGGFAFGSSVPQSVSPFQFGGQQSQAALPGSSPFQASGSMEFNAGGSFSLGSGGGPTDKSNRRIVKPVRNNKHRRK